jgi:hypothetical protein
VAEDFEDRGPGADDVRSGLETGAIVSIRKIKARDLTAKHVGNFVTDYDPHAGANVPAKIMNVRHVTEGEAPGASVLLRLPALRDGTPAHNVSLHVPFDHEFQFVEIIGH